MRPADVLSSVTSLGTIDNRKQPGRQDDERSNGARTTSSSMNGKRQKHQQRDVMGLNSIKRKHSNANSNSNSKVKMNDDNDSSKKSGNDLRNTFIPTARTNLFNRSITNESGRFKTAIASPSPRHEVTPVIPNRSVSGGMEADDTFSHIGGSVDGTSKPSTIWYQSQYQISQVPDTKHVINSVCSNYLFPRVKFINNRKDLVYSLEANSICQHVISQCNLASFVNKQEWWLKHCKMVMSTLTSLRSNKATALRLAFFGELVVGVIKIVLECN